MSGIIHMKKISSDKTRMHKVVFPLLMLGITALMMFILVGIMIRDREPGIPLIGFMLLAGVYVYSEARKRFVGLADEVWDDGDELLVRNRGMETRIAISNIRKLKYGGFGNSHFVVLTLREPCRFGDRIRFVPPRKLLQFFKNPMIVDLARRIRNSAGVIE
jgi:hypothetical protein